MAPKTLVLVTGITGFIASEIALTFLKNGFAVRGTVRSEAKAEGYKALHSTYGDDLTFAIVPDIAAPDAFIEAAKGVEIFLHTASPLQAQTTEDLANSTLIPALKGTEEALKAASASPSVKQVIITSSVAAVMGTPVPIDTTGKVYTEADWNPATYEQGVNSPSPLWAYAVSKALSEKAAWKYVEEHKPSWTLSTILPSLTFGPPTNPPTPGKPLSGTNMLVFVTLFTPEPAPSLAGLPFVDVRDVAEATLLAAQKPEVSAGERFIITQTRFTPDKIVPLFKEWFPKYAAGVIPEGYKPPPVFLYDGSKAEKVLGLKYRPHEVTLKETAEYGISVVEKVGSVPAAFGKTAA